MHEELWFDDFLNLEFQVGRSDVRTIEGKKLEVERQEIALEALKQRAGPIRARRPVQTDLCETSGVIEHDAGSSEARPSVSRRSTSSTRRGSNSGARRTSLSQIKA